MNIYKRAKDIKKEKFIKVKKKFKFIIKEIIKKKIKKIINIYKRAKDIKKKKSAEVKKKFKFIIKKIIKKKN